MDAITAHRYAGREHAGLQNKAQAMELGFIRIIYGKCRHELKVPTSNTPSDEERSTNVRGSFQKSRAKVGFNLAHQLIRQTTTR